MPPEQFLLTPETLQKFVPFDELTVEARRQLVPQAEVMCIPQEQLVSDAVLDPHYTLYLLDGELALMAGERLVDTVRSASPISRFPLSRLRSGQLSARAMTPVNLLRIRRDLVSELLNADSRAKNPPHAGASAPASSNPKGILTAMEAVASPAARNPKEQQQLSTALARAEAEIESALHDKAEATIARRLWASGFHGLDTPADKTDSSSLESQMARLLSNQSQLEQRSRDASETLARAQGKKLALERALRSLEANDTEQHPKAGAICRQHQDQVEAQFGDEVQRLENQCQQVAMKLAQLDKARRTAHQRLEAERRRLEDRFSAAHRRLQKEAADVEAALATARETAAQRADDPSSKDSLPQERLRREVETHLHQARTRLEAELKESEVALGTAQRELDAARSARQAAEQEAKQLASRLGADTVLSEEEGAETLSRSVSPVTATACVDTDEPKSPVQEIERAFPGSLGTNARADGEKQTTHFTKDEGHSTTEEELRAELEAIKQELTRADRRVTEATQMKEQAAQAKVQVEEQVARHRAVEDELRLEIYEETEERLREERQPSEQDAAASLALVEAMRGQGFSSVSQSRVDSNQAMMIDIQQQLDRVAAAPVVGQAMQEQDKAEADRRAAFVRCAQEKVQAERLKAKRDLQRAREHLIELRTKMQQTPPSSPD